MIESKEFDDLDFKLAEALGLRPIQYVSAEVGKTVYGTFVGWQKGPNHRKLFNPTRNWDILGPLMIKHGLYPIENLALTSESDEGAYVLVNGEKFTEYFVEAKYYDKDIKQQDKETAVRVAVVRGLVAKLAPQT